MDVKFYTFLIFALGGGKSINFLEHLILNCTRRLRPTATHNVVLREKSAVHLLRTEFLHSPGMSSYDLLILTAQQEL
jgi:hypothetical protein